MSSPLPESLSPDALPDWLGVVRRRVDALSYGTVQITVHAGRVTQVESLERTRFPLEGDGGRRL